MRHVQYLNSRPLGRLLLSLTKVLALCILVAIVLKLTGILMLPLLLFALPTRAWRQSLLHRS